MIKVGNEAIQAFPITERTFVGIASDYASGGTVLHAAEDGSINFNFANVSVTVDVVAGQDLALDPDIETISSTGTVWIS
jgi:hypothetical protein